jgi:CDP-diglyceride synthetase
MLVDQCIRHFGDWWLMGVKDTSAWGFEMWDTANQYVSTCENSGLLPFLLLIAILVYGFKYVGSARRAARKDKKTALFMWALGSALFANMVAFLGISYFDQTIVIWYTLLAMISAATVVRSKKALSQVQFAAAPSEAGLAVQVTEEISGLRTVEAQ